MNEHSSEAPRTKYQAPVVEEIGQIHEVGERKVWELGTGRDGLEEAHDARFAVNV